MTPAEIDVVAGTLATSHPMSRAEIAAFLSERVTLEASRRADGVDLRTRLECVAIFGAVLVLSPEEHAAVTAALRARGLAP